jgi:hypothetical protein
MTDYREILRLSSLGINHSRITESRGIARQTMVTTLQWAVAQELSCGKVEAFVPLSLRHDMTTGLTAQRCTLDYQKSRFPK